MTDESVVATDPARRPLKLGILIVGSLIWDSIDVRRKWRAERLNVTSRTPVPVPIRYGRRSQSRGDSYTMVFSRSLDPDLLGQAIVVPCRGQVSDIGDLVAEAEWLWAAERNCSRCSCVSGNWGCVSVVENENKKLPKTLRGGWTQHVSGRTGYGEMCGPAGEPSAAGRDGFLEIAWPLENSELHLDAILATATKPVEDTRYPEPLEVAEAWSEGKGKCYIEYFLNNRAHGITTLQDVAIENHLRRLWK